MSHSSLNKGSSEITTIKTLINIIPQGVSPNINVFSLVAHLVNPLLFTFTVCAPLSVQDQIILNIRINAVQFLSLLGQNQ